MNSKSSTFILLEIVASLFLITAVTGCKPSIERYAPQPADADAPTEYQTTESGLKYRLLRKYVGEPAGPGDDVRVMMRGSLDDGYIFDTTYSDNHPMHLNFTGVIPGMQEGLALVGERGMIEIVVPPELGYGSRGQGNIPPNSTLTFLIEVQEIRRPEKKKSYRSTADEPLEPDANMPEEFSTTKSGVKYRVRVSTDRPKPTSLDTLSVFYRARLNDAEGEIFNDTYHIGHARHGPLNMLPIGIQEAIEQCSVSGSVECIVPPELLGDHSLKWMSIPHEDKNVLPANTPIHFILEVTRIQLKDAPTQ